MGKRIARTVLRMNLEKEADRRAWEYLQRIDRKAHKSYSHAIVTAINDFFSRQERLMTDPYLETKEKENAFLQSVLDTIAKGLQGMSVVGTPAGMSPSLQGFTTPTPAFMQNEDAAKEEAINAALDFVNSF